VQVNCRRPIGVFDSGVGGLGIFQRLVEDLPQENIIYYADNGNSPYGNKSLSEIRSLTIAVVKKLIMMDCKLIVVACNTATISSIEYLRASFDVPFVGVVPAIKVANQITKNGRIGVLGTERTLQDSYVDWLTKSFAATQDVCYIPAQRLVSAIEDYCAQDIDEQMDVLTPLLEESKIDSLVLGCTHYTLIYETWLRRFPRLNVIDSNDAVVRQTKRLLGQHQIENLSGEPAWRSVLHSGTDASIKRWLDKLMLTHKINFCGDYHLMPRGFEFWRNKKIHIIGILGSGMSALAQYLQARGASVSGSDHGVQNKELSRKLIDQQIKLYPSGHSAEYITSEITWVVASSAINEQNIELVTAKEYGIPILRRTELLSLITRKHDTLAVCGSHGKTTISSYLASLGHAYDIPCTSLIGAQVTLPQEDNNYFSTGEDHLFLEADEYARTFLGIKAQTVIVSSIDDDHKEVYPTQEDIQQAFMTFVVSQSPYPLLIANSDDPGVKRLLPVWHALGIQVVTVSLHDKQAHYYANQILNTAIGTSFSLHIQDHAPIHDLVFNHWGRHNLSNLLLALAAFFTKWPNALAQFEKSKTLPSFFFPRRRLEILQESPFCIVDDFGHHPTEVEAAVDTALAHLPQGGRLMVFFGPHLFSRTKFFCRQFATILAKADYAYVLDIYPSREVNTENISSQLIIEQAKRQGHHNVFYLPSPIEGKVLRDIIKQHNIQNQDIILTVGAGGLWDVPHLLCQIKRD